MFPDFDSANLAFHFRTICWPSTFQSRLIFCSNSRAAEWNGPSSWRLVCQARLLRIRLGSPRAYLVARVDFATRVVGGVAEAEHCREAAGIIGDAVNETDQTGL